MILGTELQLVLHTSPYCPSCPVTHLCHEQNTARGCWPEVPQHPNLLHPTKRDFRERITEVNGFDFDDVQALDLKTPPIPRYIPRIRIGAGIGGYDLVAAVGIALREVERLAANVRLRGRPAKEILGIPPGHALIVLGFEKDSFLEDAWRPERRRSILEAMRAVRPDLAVAWGFSRIRDLDKVWPGCSVTNFGAYFAAFFRYKRRYGLHAWWADDDDVSRQVIFQDAVRQYVTFLRRPDRPDRPVFYGTATPYRRESFESLPIVQPEGVGTARPVDAVQLRLPILDDRRTPSVVGV